MIKKTIELKDLKRLDLNESVEITKGSLNVALELIMKLTTENAAYDFSVEPKTTTGRVMLITRRLPISFLDRAAYFDSISKTKLKKTLKEVNGVKVKAAAILGMSPRTFRRKMTEFEMPY